MVVKKTYVRPVLAGACKRIAAAGSGCGLYTTCGKQIPAFN